MRSTFRGVFYAVVVVAILFLARTTPAQGPAQNPSPAVADNAVDRALAAHGPKWTTGEIADYVADGRFTFFGPSGPVATFPLTLSRKGNTRVQRIIKQPAGELKQGTDGTNSWEGIPGFYTPAAQGRALQFLESQTTRSMQRLFDHQKEGLTLRDAGMQGRARVIEVEDRQGKKTSYFIDADKDLINRIEFVTGQLRDPFSGAMVTDTDAYVFSDYRQTQGVAMPFKIERYNGSNKTEEMQFDSVKYNAGLKDGDFRR